MPIRNRLEHVGVSGSQLGGTPQQLLGLRKLLVGAKVLHHGDCKGIDEQAHYIGRELGLWIVVHPPDNPSKRAFCQGDEMRDEKPYLERDRDIVDESIRLIGCPNTYVNQVRSGTWYTIRYAIDKIEVTVVFPDGTTKEL